MMANELSPIICGTDFSKNAEHAATVAAVLAARSGKPLLLVHAADELNAFDDNKKELTEFLRPLEKQLKDEADRLRRTGATIETKVLTGQLAEKAIEELGEKRAASLVVVSSVSKTPFNRWTLGSVSEYLAQISPVPTLVVRSAAPFEAWARGERPLKVFVAADFASASEAALQWVHNLRDLGRCDIVVVHVNRPGEQSARLGVAPSILENPPVVQSVLERDLREKVRAHLGEESVRIMVEPALGRLDARLIDLAMEEEADLIVVGTHQRHGFSRINVPSVSRGIQRHAPMNVVCVSPWALVQEKHRIPEIRRVLVATDFSEMGDRAVSFAYALLPVGGMVYLLHVTPPLPLPNPLSLNFGLKVNESMKEHATRLSELSARLQTLMPSGANDRGVTSDIAAAEGHKAGMPPVSMYYGVVGEAHVVEDSNPARAIRQAAERFGADVICLGSHGRSGLSVVLMGSVAQAVMTESTRPVLLVRPSAA